MEKINAYINKNIIKITYIIIILQPIIDLLIGISLKFNILFNIASIFRFIILLFYLYYYIISNKKNNNKIIPLLLCFIFLYIVARFINYNFSIDELKNTLKIFYFPLLFVFIYRVFENSKTLPYKKYLLISLLIYAFVIIAGFITNTSFASYAVAKTGSSGYFYAANEISGIISILLPFVFGYVFNKINIKKIIYFITIVLAIVILGTKTPILSFILCSIYYICKIITKKNIIKIVLASIIVISILFSFIVRTPFYKNLVIHYNYLKISNVTEIFTNPKIFDHYVLGSRLKFLNENAIVYNNSNINDKLLGIGYEENSKLVEMDIFDIIYRQGIIGFILYFYTIFSLIILVTKKINKNYIFPILLILLVSTIVGHILIAPAVSTFVALILCGFIKEDKNENKYNSTSI